jgi:lycopene cyclase domain-containing protein
LTKEVPYLVKWGILETKYAYLYLHIFTVVPVFLLSFDRKVAYFRTWNRLWAPILLVGVFFVLLDILFTAFGVWGFNNRYISGLNLWNLPVEEVLFFVTVPFACVFIYECLNKYFPGKILGKREPRVTVFLILIFFAVAFINFERTYTFLTFFLAGLFLLISRWVVPSFVRDRYYLAYLVSLFPFLIVNGVLTGGFTDQPIVMYNEEEYMGIRIFTIPLEDSIYGFLLLMLVVSGFEKKQTHMN